MMLSSDVLPAPFGPIMARISPLRMSKETPVTALTPPNESDTLSTESSTSPAAMSRPVGALMPPLRGAFHDVLATRAASSGAPHPDPLPMKNGERERTGTAAPLSCRLLQDAGYRNGLEIADLHARAKHALAPILERHLGRDVGLLFTGIERGHERSIQLRDEAPAHFLRPRALAVIGIELLVQDEKAADLGTGHCLLARERAVHFLDMLRQHVVDQRMPRQLLIGAIDDVAALGP